MDAKNVEALTYGPEYMLAKFANLPDKRGDSKPAQEFRERWGELFPGLDPENYWRDVADFRKAWHAKGRDSWRVGVYLTDLFSRNLRFHVKSEYDERQAEPLRERAAAKKQYTADELDALNQKFKVNPAEALREMLQRERELPSEQFHGILSGDARYFPAVKVDFSSGRIEIDKPRSLLDWLANSLLECRHRLGICERKGCTAPYFVKDHPRRRFCSEDCFRQARKQKKNQWWKANRGRGSKKTGTHKIRAKNSAKRGRRGGRRRLPKKGEKR